MPVRLISAFKTSGQSSYSSGLSFFFRNNLYWHLTYFNTQVEDVDVCCATLHPEQKQLGKLFMSAQIYFIHPLILDL